MAYLFNATKTKRLKTADQKWCNFYVRLIVNTAVEIVFLLVSFMVDRRHIWKIVKGQKSPHCCYRKLDT